MKRNIVGILSVVVLFCMSCNKGNNDNSNPPATSTFTVKVDNVLTTFNVTSATLLRSSGTSEKRFDLMGISTDNQLRLVLTIGEETAIGNGITITDHPVSLFVEDDPETPEDEEQEDTNAFFTLSTNIGSDSWFTNVYAVTGNIKITANNPGTTTGTISGSFNGELKSLPEGAKDFSLKDGSFTNISYNILN